MKIRDIILEGGNVQIGDKEAQRMDLTKLNRATLVPTIQQALVAINAGYQKMFKQPMWAPELLASGEFLSGSSLHFFNLAGISTEKFVANKPTVGDIDTQVDQNLADNAAKFLTAATGKKFGPATLIGFKPSAAQLITLWGFDNPAINIQIDLEFVDYAEGRPTEWSAFSHSSAWEDIEAGVKGVFHKYLLRALSTPSLRDVVVLSGKKEVAKKVKTTDLAFAVTKGLRYKLAPVMDGDQQRQIDGLPVFKEIPTKDSTYMTNLGELAGVFFGADLPQSEIKMFWSFVGTLQLVKKYFTPEQQAGVIMGFAYTLFGPSGQEIYRGEPDKDLADKNAALAIMTKTLNIPYNKTAINKLRKEYYDK